jgi:hypothetical protein
MVLLGNPGGKSQLGRPRSREGNIQMDANRIGSEGVAWINLAKDRDKRHAVGNIVMNLNVL